MLIEFSVKNYRSIKDKQTLSLVASNLSEVEDKKNNIFSVDNISLLKVASIYGANASGKSNFFRSLDVMRDIVCKSAYIKEQSIPVTPFLLNEQKSKEPTEFEVIFIHNGIKYQYGFSTTKERIYDEWLFVFPKGKAQLWFEREYNSESNVTTWTYGSHFKGNKKVWEKATRDNALFLSTALQLNSDSLKPLGEWFTDKLGIFGANVLARIFTKKYCESTENKKDIMCFIRAADLGIADFSLMKEDEVEIKSLNEIPEKLKEILSWDAKHKINTIHQTDTGKSVSFDLEKDESEGTQKLFFMLGPFFNAYEKGHTIFIDELDCSLHPQIVHFIIKQFCDPKINKSNAQLVFTTHDVSLLAQHDLFRRDQVWFINKNLQQESELYPLTDFHLRKDMKFEKAYLSGRFGAVPNISFNDDMED